MLIIQTRRSGLLFPSSIVFTLSIMPFEITLIAGRLCNGCVEGNSLNHVDLDIEMFPN